MSIFKKWHVKAKLRSDKCFNIITSFTSCKKTDTTAQEQSQMLGVPWRPDEQHKHNGDAAYWILSGMLCALMNQNERYFESSCKIGLSDSSSNNS